MPETESPTYDVKLTAPTYGGESLGRLPDGRAVFVPFALPGETVHIRLVSEKRGHARAELLQVLEPSPLRIQPPCRHFTHCGGCHYQHLAYAEQLALKSKILGEQLGRIGGLTDFPLKPTVASPDPFHYRNHIQFHLTEAGKLGFFASDGVTVFPVEECLLPEPPLNQLWAQLDFEAIPGIERIGLRLGMDDDIQIILESDDPMPPEILVEELPVSVVHLSHEDSLVLAGSGFTSIQVSSRSFQVSAGSFFQVNTVMAEAMVEHLLANLQLTPQTTLLDVYCGVGLFSAFLTSRVGRLIGIESSSTACNDYTVNLDEFDNVELYEAAAEQVLPYLNINPDIAIVDPPRAGIDRKALDGLLALHAPAVAYISCDPATLARDARRLVEGGYRLKQVTPFDLFPQTYHIESISIWER